jgi:glycosyltransferase involved in cell wall biosynthesis
MHSVIAPIYNAAPYLQETLDSILASTYRPIEVVMVDDGSSDESLSIATAYCKQHLECQVINYKDLFSIRDMDKEHSARLNIWGAALDSPKDYSLYGLGAGQGTPYLYKNTTKKDFLDTQN